MNHSQEKLNAHVPVMSTETIKYLNPKSDGIYIDDVYYKQLKLPTINSV